MVSSDKVDSVCQSVRKSDIISLDLQFSLSQLVPKIILNDFYETTIIAKKL